jgi:hypothetical protein
VALEDAEDNSSVHGPASESTAATELTDVMYIWNLLVRMGFTYRAPTSVYEDNNACIEWGNSVIGGRERAKHIDIRKHFAHEAIQSGHMLPVFVRVPTAYQLADILTKGLHAPQWLSCVDGILRSMVITGS